MRAALRILLISTVLSLGLGAMSASRAFGFELNPEVDRFEKSLETRLQERLTTFFGEDAKLMVSVHVTENAALLKPKPNDMTDSEPGYAPFPLELEDGTENTVRTLSIKSVEVNLQVPGELDSKTIEEAKKLVTNTISGLPAKVTVTQFAIQKSKPASETAIPEKQEPKWDLKSYFPIIAALGSALILALGITFVGSALRSLANSIGEGIRIALGTIKVDNKNPPFDPLAANGHQKTPEKTKVALESAVREYGRNVELVQSVLKQDPMLLALAVEDNDSEWRGIKSLLPSLTQVEQDTLRKCLGSAKLKHLASVDSNHEDPAGWLRDFVERLMLRKLQGGSKVERMMGTEAAIALRMLKPDQLLQAARQSASPAAWRIFSEFLAKEDAGAILKNIEDSEWQLMISAAHVSEEEIQNTAIQMAQFVQQKTDSAAEDLADYYKEKLLTPIVEALRIKEPGKEDLLLQNISSAAPEFATLVRQKFWTMHELALVPDSFLAQALRDLNYEQKAHLILGLPDPEAKRIESLLPEGNVRTIVLDQLKRAWTQDSPNDRKVAAEVCRRFLDYLMVQAHEGKFRLNEAAPDQRMAA